MSIRPRLLLGLLVIIAATAAAAVAEEAAERQAGQPAPSPASASTQESNQSEPVGNGQAPTDAPAAPAQRAADVAPTSWSNVKALWG